MSVITERVRAVRDRIARAAERAGRDPASVQLVAVSKTKSVAEVREAVEAGVRVFGENYVQELLAKREGLGEAAEWHYIGHLQTNKAKYLVPFCALIHSVDSARLATEIDRRAQQFGRRQPVLIEVKLSEEETKSGIDPGGVVELAQAMTGLPGLDLRGLMVMPPFSEDPGASRPYFVRLRELREALRGAGSPSGSCAELSMGMTMDFEVAIEEGATIVRVGTAIFGPRQPAGA
jgi:PLP dependent protein